MQIRQYFIIVKSDPLNIQLSYSEKAKHVRIKISHKKEVHLIVPIAVDVNIAYDFLRKKETWVKKHLNRMNLQAPPANGNIPIYGEPHQITLHSERIPSLISIQDGQILISNELCKTDVPLMLGAYLKKILKHDIEKHTQHLSAILNVTPGKIRFRDTKSQWGSCAPNGDLSFSWRLIFAPKFVMEYLVAHELCHLIERNHSHRYWKLVANVDPNYKRAKNWLRTFGRSLHNIEL